MFYPTDKITQVLNNVRDIEQNQLKMQLDEAWADVAVWKQRYIGLLMSLVEPDEIQDVLDTLEYE